MKSEESKYMKSTVYWIEPRLYKVRKMRKTLIVEILDDGTIVVGGLKRRWPPPIFETVDKLRKALEDEGLHPESVEIVVEEVRNHPPGYKLEFNGLFYPRSSRERWK